MKYFIWVILSKEPLKFLTYWDPVTHTHTPKNYFTSSQTTILYNVFEIVLLKLQTLPRDQ